MTERYKFGNRSESNLANIDPKLVQVARLALIISNVDFAVVEGVRTLERQKMLYAQGRTAPGAIVTKTMKSRHLVQPDGLGHAIDCAPVNPITGKVDWKYSEGFQEVADAMRAAADRLDIKIRWGGDWDGDGIEHEKGETDSPHFETPA